MSVALNRLQTEWDAVPNLPPGLPEFLRSKFPERPDQPSFNQGLSALRRRQLLSLCQEAGLKIDREDIPAVALVRKLEVAIEDGLLDKAFQEFLGPKQRDPDEMQAELDHLRKELARLASLVDGKTDPLAEYRDLKAKAEEMGLDTKGMKKADIEAALKASEA